MSQLYQQRLAKLKRELSIEVTKRKKKKKKFTPNQQIMIDFINNVTKNATFYIKDMKIILRKGHSGAGFQHILEKHYCNECPGKITLSDILNMDLIIQRGLKLNSVGVTNPDNIVINYKNRDKEHNIILKSEKENELVVSFYSIN
ncbi:hypothetical protein AMRN_1179 [Malaciobacter marinus]|uniref:Uncharacterized protein n=2 Tax=Malaciobacter TaxID=2321114 RepID=A0A1T5DMZ3_9BACT|nr:MULTISPECIES: hypothetical protein [Malaciobacter]AXX86924.1 hypothetical protein AMRN_1179 [Malaciobacter marinus]PHO10218.1 hypothetical protein CPG37_05985 [Malaciobacter canalis]PHO15878.1 hypothetical protein CPH92_04725 [Malaciobacter marinus]PPK59851.1 hypothetical protein B0F89_1306 [Malaciobacter marinus]QEE32710.1 hypothetical protein ACAN_1226 [Malaciobacter canalis]